MQPALPLPSKLDVHQFSRAFSPQDLDQLDFLIVVAAKGDEKAIAAKAGLEKLAARLAGRDKENVTLPLGERLVTVARLAADATAFEMLDAARKWLSNARLSRPAVLGLAFDDGVTSREAIVEAVTAAALAADFRMPKLSTQPQKDDYALRELHVFDLDRTVDLARTFAMSEGGNLARWLAALPGNYLTPGKYREYVEQLAGDNGWEAEFLDEETLKQKNAGAFLAVVQGSADRDAGIMHLRYRPKQAAEESIALVGKGICFDTGGNNLKSAKSMFGMHGDMQGSAVALGTLLALSRLDAPFEIDCWLALAQNHIGPRAYKMNDVITASDGTTIEIVHTDAEGRMVLADTLALASAARPGMAMDFATLTGACVHALGTRYSGVFTNREDRIFDLIEAGKRSGERVWPFPQDRDFDELLESRIADVKQCLIEGEADHILAGRFLSRFVKNDVPWVHVDLAASESKGGLAHVPTEFTGFGVRFAVEYLMNRRG